MKYKRCPGVKCLGMEQPYSAFDPDVGQPDLLEVECRRCRSVRQDAEGGFNHKSRKEAVMDGRKEEGAMEDGVMRTCTKCGEQKEPKDFPKSGGGQCLACKREYAREHWRRKQAEKAARPAAVKRAAPDEEVKVPARVHGTAQDAAEVMYEALRLLPREKGVAVLRGLMSA